MTSKELLYVEDVLGHEKHFQAQCCQIANSISDPELKDFVRQLECCHREIFQSFYNLL